MSRDTAIRQFLEQAGWGDATRHPINGDMSYRRYERLERSGDKALLMDAPPAFGEDCRPFVAICSWLKGRGYSAPDIHAVDLEQGFMVLEDLGTGIYARLMEAGRPEEALYNLAIDWLVDVQKQPAPNRMPIEGQNDFPVRPYDAGVLVDEVQLFARWFLPTVTGKPVSDAFLSRFVDLWTGLAPLGVSDTPVLVHRDYHAENLIYMEARQGLAGLGVIDFQDGVAGHPAYDLVSLLEDARRDVDPMLAARLKRRYLDATGHDEERFNQAYAVIGAQRNLRIVGVFSRYWLRRGIDRNLKLIPRVFRYIEQDLKHPVLADMKTFLDAEVPDHWRYEAPDLSLRDSLLEITGPLENREP